MGLVVVKIGETGAVGNSIVTGVDLGNVNMITAAHIVQGGDMVILIAGNKLLGDLIPRVTAVIVSILHTVEFQILTGLISLQLLQVQVNLLGIVVQSELLVNSTNTVT